MSFRTLRLRGVGPRLGMAAATLGLAGCGEPPTVDATRAPDVLVAGSPGAIDRFEQAARTCGLDRFERTRRSADEVQLRILGLPPRAPRPGDPILCAMGWMTNHSVEDLHLIERRPPG